MKPTKENTKQGLNIIIYAQGGVLAGDLVALLSGHHHVDLETDASGVLNTINIDTDVLLLVKDSQKVNALDPMVVLSAARRAHCKVVLLGDWQETVWGRCKSWIVLLPAMPSPSVLMEAISKRS